MAGSENLRMVRLIEPGMCLSCRFCRIVNATMADGSTRKTIHCRRELCDNHDWSHTEDGPVSMESASPRDDVPLD